MKFAWVLLFVVGLVASQDSDNDVTTQKPSPKQGTAEQRTKLLKSLTENYERSVNPDNADVKLGVSLINVELNEEKSTLESNVWMKYTWKDSRLAWDAAEWGIGVLRADPSKFWKPDIMLYNGADLSQSQETCGDTNVLLYPEGKVLWVPPCHLSSFCKNTLKERPYDDQTCTWKFGSWTYDSDIMDISFYQNQTFVDTNDMWELSRWKVVGSSAVKNIKYYNCCPEPYADLTFNITIKRKPESESLCSA